MFHGSAFDDIMTFEYILEKLKFHYLKNEKHFWNLTKIFFCSHLDRQTIKLANLAETTFDELINNTQSKNAINKKVLWKKVIYFYYRKLYLQFINLLIDPI